MSRRRRPLKHPLAKLFQRSVTSLTTSLSPGSVAQYHGTVRHFLTYLGARYPQIRSLQQLRRDPHLLGWLALLWSHTPPLAKITRATHVIRLRRLLEHLAATQQLPTLAHMLGGDDIPRRDEYLPRPLTPEQDQLIRQELLRRNDLISNVLLLLRHTGMRIGECVDLSWDCLRFLPPDHWAIHVPLGKLLTERWVPVDAFVCQLVHRLRFLRSLEAQEPDGRLLVRPLSRGTLVHQLRAALAEITAAAGITTRIVPHQFRHTYATEMLRAGVSFPAVMKLLGHKTPQMTLRYLELTQLDLQREFHRARSHPRHLAPPPRVPAALSSPRPDLASLLVSFHAAQHILEMFRRTLPAGVDRRLLDRLANRLTKLIAETRKLNPL
jgi:integrase